MSHPIAPLGAGPEVTLLSWSFEPAVLLPAAAAAALYLGGWATLSRRMPERFDAARAAAFLAGLAVVVLALCSPLDALGHHLLQAHMIQHLLLMLVAPPLLWLGAPVAPLLLGLPRPARRVVAVGLARDPRGGRRAPSRTLASPGWRSSSPSGSGTCPALYDIALRSDGWHHVEHACFFLTALVFWRPVILAWPARSAWPRWAMIVYLVLAETQNTLLSAILTFSDRVIYPFYAAGSGRPSGVSALEDQALAGVIMWVPGSLAFLVPVLWLLMSMLAGPGAVPTGQGHPDEHAAPSAP